MSLAKIDGEAGDDVLVQRLEDELPPCLQTHAYEKLRDLDVKLAALDRIQRPQEEGGDVEDKLVRESERDLRVSGGRSR